MGRPPSNGGPSFRFNPTEVAEMEAVLQGHNTQVPAREVLVSLAEKFSASPERRGKFVVQMKQVWNWFQNRRYAIRAKTFKAPTPPSKVTAPVMPQSEPTIVRTVPQAPQPSPPVAVTVRPMTQAHQGPQAIAAPSASAGRNGSDNSQMEFEAKSARDGAWYDVSKFLSHKSMETGDPEVLVRFAGFGSEEDEWVNVRKNVRQRSLPCESSECVAVLPGDLILCFQEGKEQALYFDAHVLDAQRRRHDIRGCRCRFLVRYDHDQSEEIVPLRKICRRPETDYRLEQQNADSAKQSKTSNDPIQTANTPSRVFCAPTAEAAQKPPPPSAIISSSKTTEPMAKKMKTDVHLSASAQVDVSASTLKHPKAVEQQNTFIDSQTRNTLKVCPPAEPPKRFTPPAEPTLSPLAEPALLPQAGPTLSSLAEPPPTAEPALPPPAEPALPPPAEPALPPPAEPALPPPAEPALPPPADPALPPPADPALPPPAESALSPPVEPALPLPAEPTSLPSAEPTLLSSTNPPLIPLSEPTLPLAVVPALTPPDEPALQLPTEPALPPPAESSLVPPAKPSMPPPAEPALLPPAEPTLLPPAEPTLPPPAELTLPPPHEPALPPPAEPALPPPAEPALPPPAEPALPPPAEPALTPSAKRALTFPAEPALTLPAEPALTPSTERALTFPAKPALMLPAEPALMLPAEPPLTLPAEPALALPAEPALALPAEPALTLPAEPALTQDDVMIDSLEGMDYVFDDMLASSTDMLDAIGSSGSLQQQ